MVSFKSKAICYVLLDIHVFACRECVIFSAIFSIPLAISYSSIDFDSHSLERSMERCQGCVDIDSAICCFYGLLVVDSFQPQYQCGPKNLLGNCAKCTFFYCFLVLDSLVVIPKHRSMV